MQQLKSIEEMKPGIEELKSGKLGFEIWNWNWGLQLQIKANTWRDFIGQEV